MKKRIISAMLIAAMAAVMTAGCGAKEEAPATETAAAAGTEEAVKLEDDTDAPESEAAGTEKSGDTFTVGFDQDFPPMGFVGEDGEFTGFDLELAAEVAKRLGKEIVYQPIAWDAKDMELESGTIDCIWNGFTMNGREDSYTWSEPYMKNNQVFVVKADAGISTKADLAGKVVDVQTDSSAEAALKDDEELMNSFGQLVTVADYNTAFMDLESGAVDAIAMDDVVASYQIEQRQVDFVVLDETLAAEEYGIGFKMGNEELRDQVQDTLKDMAADGTLAEISNKWFGKDITTIGK
ncbi:amino acid ABC transporter substrate-binding protein [Lachnospiraceae bacterium 46-15]